MIDAGAKGPLVLLDVDGVLHDRARRDQVRLSPDPAGSAIERGVTIVRAYGRSLAFPNHMAALIQRITSVADVYWCTTWRDRANDEIREHLGIHPLPVVDDGTNDPGFSWKAEAATPIVEAALTSERDVFWIEDFRGSIPDIDRRVQLIDTTDVGFLTAQHLEGTPLSLD